MASQDPKIPAFRSEVALIAAEDENRLPYAAMDRVLGQKIRLDHHGMAVATALKHPKDPNVLLNELQSLGVNLAPDLLVRFIRFLDSHYLLETPRAQEHIDAVNLADQLSQSPNISFVPGTSHGCVACGHSCTSHDVGPIDDEQVNAIKSELPNAQFLWRDTQDKETTGHYCTMKEDACSLLTPENLCGVHAALGMQAKPTDCQLFPLSFTRTPTGVVGGIRLECRSYIASKRNGEPMEHRAAEVESLFQQLPWTEIVDPIVRLDDTFTAPYGVYQDIEEALQTQVQASSTILWDGIHDINHRAIQLVDAARKRDQQGWVFPPAIDSKTEPKLAEFMDAYLEGCITARGMNDLAGNTLRVQYVERVYAAAERLKFGTPLDSTLNEDDNELLRDLFTQSIHLKKPLLGPNVMYGFALLNMTILLAVANANETGDLNGALSDVLKVQRMGPIQRQLHKHKTPLTHLFHCNMKGCIDRFSI